MKIKATAQTARKTQKIVTTPALNFPQLRKRWLKHPIHTMPKSATFRHRGR